PLGPRQSTVRTAGQSRRETQFVGWQQRTTTSNEQQSFISAPVNGSRQVMHVTTVVFPFGKREPDLWLMVVPVTRWHGSIIFGSGKFTMAPADPSHWIEISVGQLIRGRH